MAGYASVEFVETGYGDGYTLDERALVRDLYTRFLMTDPDGMEEMLHPDGLEALHHPDEVEPLPPEQESIWIDGGIGGLRKTPPRPRILRNYAEARGHQHIINLRRLVARDPLIANGSVIVAPLPEAVLLGMKGIPRSVLEFSRRVGARIISGIDRLPHLQGADFRDFPDPVLRDLGREPFETLPHRPTTESNPPTRLDMNTLFVVLARPAMVGGVQELRVDGRLSFATNDTDVLIDMQRSGLHQRGQLPDYIPPLPPDEAARRIIEASRRAA